MRRLWGEIERLRKAANDRTTRDARQFVRGRDRRPEFPSTHARCLTCKGNGFTTDFRTVHDISKCRDCNGTGTIGRALPVIERLWYEIDRLKREMKTRIEEEVKKRGIVATSITDRDIWLHLLGLEGDADHDAVKKAYKKKAAECHPDSGGSDLAFRAVKRAYDELMKGSL